MLKIKRVLTIAVTVCIALLVWQPAQLSTAQSVAQSTAVPSALLKALKFVPNTPEIRNEIVSFVDYYALIESRLGAAHPKSWTEYEAWTKSNPDGVGLYRSVLSGVVSGVRDFGMSYFRGDDMIKVTGVDPMKVEQSIEFGRPPALGSVLLGKFEPRTIEAALLSAGFQKATIGGMNALCNPKGCDAGAAANPETRQISNPFGGQLGRKQPIIPSNTYVFSSTSLPVVENILKAQQGTIPSLADLADYAAVANVFSQGETLLQVNFIPTAIFLRYSAESALAGLAGDLGKLRVKEELKRLAAEFDEFTPYSLMALVHSADQTYMYTSITLVYNNAADAQKAIDVIAKRTETYAIRRSPTVRIELSKLISERGATIEAPRIVSDKASGKVLAVFSYSVAVDSTFKANEGVGVSLGSLVYRLFLDFIFRQEMGWIVPKVEVK